MLTPADIDTKQFKATRLKEGYDQDEVDTFLDRVHEDYSFLSAQVARLEAENANLRRAVRPASEAPTAQLPAQTPSAVAERLLVAAQQAHDEHVAEGRSKADDIVREAGSRAAKIVEEATEAAERLKSEGLAEKYRRNDELDQKIANATNTLSQLDQRGQQVRRALADMINSYDTEFPR